MLIAAGAAVIAAMALMTVSAGAIMDDIRRNKG